MNPPDLPPAFDSASWRKRRRIWIVNIVLSSLAVLALPAAAFGAMTFGVSRISTSLGTSGTEVGEMSKHIDRTLTLMSIGAVLGILALIWLAVSIAMFCAIPKPFHGMIR